MQPVGHIQDDAVDADGEQHVGERLRRSEAYWRGLFERLTEGFMIVRVVRDDGGVATSWLFEQMNAAWDASLASRASRRAAGTCAKCCLTSNRPGSNATSAWRRAARLPRSVRLWTRWTRSTKFEPTPSTTTESPSSSVRCQRRDAAQRGVPLFWSSATGCATSGRSLGPRRRRGRIAGPCPRRRARRVRGRGRRQRSCPRRLDRRGGFEPERYA